MFYPQEVIDQVIDANNIVDVIGSYVKLNKKGSTYFGLCPFHNEKTPSFSVTDNGNKQMFYCFGCHTGGSVLTFIQKYENCTYSEALKILADRAGITLPKPDYSQADAARAKRREEILEVNKLAAVYFYHLLKSNRGTQAYNYLRERGLSDETIRNFGLGYSDKYRDDLYKYIKTKGYSDEILKESGLFVINEKDTRDYFWNRVMFPIMDVRSKVIGFGGRVMGQGEPKYLNSPETVCFDKSRTLFGLNAARKYKGREFILVEGYMDVVSLHQAGFTNAVASLGTALTDGNVGVLRRFTENVIISYDSDLAGRDATLRAIPKLRDAGISVKVVNLLPYKDPDELIKAEGAEEYRNRLRNAMNSFVYEISILREGYNQNDPDEKTRFETEVARRLSYFTDDIERDNYTSAISRQFNIDLSLIRDRTKRFALNRDNIRPAQPVRSADRQRKVKSSAIGTCMEIVLSYLAKDPSFYDKISSIIDAGDFTLAPYDRIAEIMFRQLQNGKINFSGIVSSFEETEDQEKAAAIFNYDFLKENLEDDIGKVLTDCVIKIKSNNLSAKLSEAQSFEEILSIKKQQEDLKKIQISGGQ
ncbi:MAG: DNA primase [Lachnospiraceae bacterium]|nr:DNA primase [Lachnospiraceae bacterium]